MQTEVAKWTLATIIVAFVVTFIFISFLAIAFNYMFSSLETTIPSEPHHFFIKALFDTGKQIYMFLRDMVIHPESLILLAGISLVIMAYYVKE